MSANIAATPATKPARIFVDPAWVSVLESSACEVFQMMVGTVVQPLETSEEHESGEFSAMVGIAGALCAIFRLRCSGEVARSVAGKMLCEESPGEVAVLDAIGEICNMLAGNFKSKIPELYATCQLTVPTVIVGSGYEVFSLARGNRMKVSLDYEGKPIWIALDIKG